MLNPEELNEIADKTYLDELCKDMLADIEYIEKKFNTRLVGDRFDLENGPHHKMVGKATKAQLYFIFSQWRSNLFQKYK